MPIANDLNFSIVQLRSPPIANGKKCNLKFYWNTGVYYNYFEVLVLVGGIWKIGKRTHVFRQPFMLGDELALVRKSVG